MKIWLLIAAIMGIASSGIAQSATSAKGLVVGDYLRVDYIDELHKTSSPLAATVADTPQLVQVRREENHLLVVTIFNFHEGGAEFVLHSDGSVASNLAAGFDVSNVALKVSDPHHFTLGFDKFQLASYALVGNAERYVAKEVLSGRYTDQDGRSYVFGADGWATFADRRFEYLIGIDHVLNNYDYFEDKTTGKVFGFKKHGESLDVFGTSGEISQNVDNKPLLSLRLISVQK
jgi:hypothetical protein